VLGIDILRCAGERPHRRAAEEIRVTTETIHEEVRARYAQAALQATAGGCWSYEPETIGAGLSSALEHAELPEAAVLASLGCGNPIAVAELHEGERVLDLGSGGGIDVLLSAKRVGPTGRAIGLDMTDEMLALAQRNGAEAGPRTSSSQGTIEAIPLPADSVDVVISNCASTSRPTSPVFREIARVLAGRADGVTASGRGPAHRGGASERGSYTGCIAGALSFTSSRRAPGRGPGGRLADADAPRRGRHGLRHREGHQAADAVPHVDLSNRGELPIADSGAAAAELLLMSIERALAVSAFAEPQRTARPARRRHAAPPR